MGVALIVLWPLPPPVLLLEVQMTITSYPGIFIPAFVASINTVSDNHWGKKAWVQVKIA